MAALYPSPLVMNQAIFIPRPENDPRGLNLTLLNTPFQRGGAPMIELPWSHFDSVPYSPRRAMRALKKSSIATSTDSDRLCGPANEEYPIGLELAGETEQSSLVVQGRPMGQPLEQMHPLSMAAVIPDQPYPIAETYLGTTFTAPGQQLPPGPAGPMNYGERSEIKQHRERNRVAARKCRQKAKKNVADLQRREKDLGRRNRMLQGCVSSLRDEIIVLKHEILRHSECNSNVIQNYIANAARRQMG